MRLCKLVSFLMILFGNDLGRCDDDYEFVPNIFLDFKGTPASCVNPRALQENYCLSWKKSIWQKAKMQGFKCYLEQKLVYSCSSEGDCKDYGILVGNVRPLEAAQDCRGLPFANILEETVGNFVCIIKDTDRLIQASFDLELCADYIRENSVDLILELHEEPVECINETVISNYCLSPRLNGQPVKERVFTIYLNGKRVYSCEGNGVCQDHGQLIDIRQPQMSIEKCQGIALKYIKEQMLGTYSVIIEDETNLLQAKTTLQFCKDTTHSSSRINNGSLIAVIMGILAALAVTAV